MIEPALSLALSVQAHKAVYAVLLGSGVSRSAAIPTGWDVILDLTSRLASSMNEGVGSDPEAWYTGKFGKAPNYSELVQALAPTPAERMSLLKGYFEPTDADKEQGKKMPTPAHKAIAELVAAGYIRVIITTNFDRLMERALEAEGVSSTVVASPDDAAGMMPLPHVQCLVVKVHGDYLDTRIRNTPEELEKYDAATDALLDRLFSEYGLIVCGWSVDWDMALCKAIRRNTRFRFSTYWMHKSPLSQRAQDIVSFRQALTLSIEGADQAFTDLKAKVDAIAAQRVADPASPRVAVAMVKRYLSEAKYRIPLQDLILAELHTVRRATSSDVFPLGTPTPDATTYRDRVERLEAACAKLVPMVTVGVYWGQDELNPLWQRCAEALSRFGSASGHFEVWSHLKYYPARGCAGSTLDS